MVLATQTSSFHWSCVLLTWITWPDWWTAVCISRARAPNREVFVEVRAPGASESHQDETSPLNWRQSSSAPKVPEVGVTGKNDIWNQSVRFSFIFCLSALLILFRCKGLSFCFSLSHTHIDRIFCQLMLIQVLFGHETCNVQVVFYVAGNYLTPEKR